jgi:hypothetical protein
VSPRNCSNDGTVPPCEQLLSGQGKANMHDFLGHNFRHIRVNATPDRPADGPTFSRQSKTLNQSSSNVVNAAQNYFSYHMEHKLYISNHYLYT